MTETVRPEPSRMYRWLVLIFVSLAMFGSYYVYDALSPLADVLKQQLGFTDLDIGFLQAIYSFPNIFTVVIGGFIILLSSLLLIVNLFATHFPPKGEVAYRVQFALAVNPPLRLPRVLNGFSFLCSLPWTPRS